MKAFTEVLIGRQSNNTACFAAVANHESSKGTFDCRVLSRKHALIINKSGVLYLKDLDSSNGTYINSTRIEAQKEIQIKNADIIQFGQDVLDMSTHSTSKCIIAKVELEPHDYYPGETDDSVKDLNELKGVLNNLESMIEESKRDKIFKLEETLCKIKSELKQGWKNMLMEDQLISKIHALETQLINHQKSAKKMTDMEMKLQDLQSVHKKIFKHYQMMSYLNIYSSIFISLLLIAFFIFNEVFGQRQKILSVW